MLPSNPLSGTSRMITGWPHLAPDGLGHAPDLAADPDLEAVPIVVTAISLVAVDALERDACELFEIGYDGTKRCSTNYPPLGAVAGVVIETLQPNS